jgi:hypothetical protein
MARPMAVMDSQIPLADQIMIMKPNFRTQQFLPRMLLALAMAAGFVLTSAHTFADVVSANYVTGREVPIRSDGFTATDKSIDLKLNFVPAPDTQLMVVENTGPGVIIGTFSNLAQGQTVELSYRGVAYHFVAHYHGGTGNDLVLLRASDKESIPAAVLPKLDAQIVLALKKSRGEPPFDRPTTLQPDIPFQRAGSVLVDLKAPVSSELVNQIRSIGGVIDNSEPAATLRAMVPLSQLETLPARGDVKFISPARPVIRSRVKVSSGR